ncbi:hypothetical protein QJS10_CPA01g00397 [Acorus calamus]|uniref:RING-type domain-containing protein n=1 Tax=Acorus calamus TaxID=4465 RepID=A0AAV9FIJ8_ACOCL|nr:hypothetical protein QJS10_CPA01g00397 [Acorus calamus]
MPRPTPPAQYPSVWLLCRQCNCNDLVDTANEFSLTLQRIIRQQRITVNLHSKVQNISASKASVEALEEVVVMEEELCPVCKQSMGVGEMAKRMPCKHLFHVKCISDSARALQTLVPHLQVRAPVGQQGSDEGRRDPGPDANVA